MCLLILKNIRKNSVQFRNCLSKRTYVCRWDIWLQIAAFENAIDVNILAIHLNDPVTVNGIF